MGELSRRSSPDREGPLEAGVGKKEGEEWARASREPGENVARGKTDGWLNLAARKTFFRSELSLLQNNCKNFSVQKIFGRSCLKKQLLG
jgi:hypothetical protein